MLSKESGKLNLRRSRIAQNITNLKDTTFAIEIISTGWHVKIYVAHIKHFTFPPFVRDAQPPSGGTPNGFGKQQ